MDSKTLYRWEQSAGLEHACGTCPTKQNDPKARQSCYGIHTEPCPRYHQIMHFVGASHNCYPCIISNEQHEKRHTGIAELVSEYKRFEDSERQAVTPVRRDAKRRQPTNDLAQPFAATPDTEEDDSDMGEEEGSDDETHARDTSFPTIHRSMSIAEKRALKKEVKFEKSISKASKNQRKYVVTVRREDIEKVARAIHGEDYGASPPLGHPLATDKTIEEVIERNLGFVSAQQAHTTFLLKSFARERNAASKNKQHLRPESDAMDTTEVKEASGDVVEAVLAKLGIQFASPALPLRSPLTSNFSTPGSGKRTKTAILQKLSAAIVEDVENHESELKQTYQRAAGFWRYANHEILVRLTDLASQVDWATGEKLKGKDRRDSGYGHAGDPSDAGDEAYLAGHATWMIHGDRKKTAKKKKKKTTTTKKQSRDGDAQGAEVADLFDGLPYDAHSLSMLDYRSAKGIGEYFRRNGELSDIPGRFVRPMK